MGTGVSSLPSCLYLFNSTPLSSHISRETRSILWFLLVSDQNSSISSPQNPFSIEEPKTTLWCHSQAENPPPTPHSPENNSRAPCPGWQGSLKPASAHSSESHPLTHHLQRHCPSQFLETPRSLPFQGPVLAMSSAWNILLPDLPQDTYQPSNKQWLLLREALADQPVFPALTAPIPYFISVLGLTAVWIHPHLSFWPAAPIHHCDPSCWISTWTIVIF